MVRQTIFSTVGVKALDDYTVEYTLNKPESFWNSKITTATMLPVNEEFLNATGKDYGALTPSSILYNGPYFLKSLISKSVIEYEKILTIGIRKMSRLIM